MSYYKDDAAEHYVLKAHSPGSLFETLSIEFVADRPSAIAITDSLGQQTRIRFREVKINQPVDAQRFSFTPPKGADIIDDRTAD